jgi:hypothetical protein
MVTMLVGLFAFVFVFAVVIPGALDDLGGVFLLAAFVPVLVPGFVAALFRMLAVLRGRGRGGGRVWGRWNRWTTGRGRVMTFFRSFHSAPQRG